MRSRFAVGFTVALAWPVAACIGSPQAQKPPAGETASEREQMPAAYDGPLTGKESVAWLQPVGAGTRITEFTYVIYVDGVKQPLPHAECRLMHGSRHQLCQAPLPEMPPGKHTLRFGAVRVVDGKEKASSLSEPLVVTRSLSRGSS